MSRAAESAIAVRAPRETHGLVGHRDAEATLLSAYRSGRIAHAWLLGGPRGIGKATMAYRMARFVLAHGDPASAAVQGATSLDVPQEHPVARQIARGAHGGLLVLERSLNDKGVLRTVITVDESRDTIGFFGSTAAVNGWRVCIVDPIDDLNAAAANALLKIIEEPPPRSLFLLVSHAPARALPTILSRCRKLTMRPLSESDVVEAAAAGADLASSDPALREAAAAAEGSVGRALMLLGGDTLAVRRRTMALLQALPRIDYRALHALGEAMPASDRPALAAVVDSIEQFIAERLRARDAAADLPRLARLAEVWDKIGRAAREAEAYNLERKPFLFSAFGLLTEAVR